MQKIRATLRRFSGSDDSSPTSRSASVALPNFRAIFPTPATTANAISPAKGRGIIATSPSPLKSLWEKAIEKFKPEDRIGLNFDELDELKTFAEILQDIEKKRQELEDRGWSFAIPFESGDDGVLREVGDRFLAKIDKFVEIGKLAAQRSPQPVPVVWPVFRFLVQIAFNDGECLRYLLPDIEYISRILARCAAYEELYTDKAVRSVGNLLKWLPDLYTAVLLYLCRYKHYLSLNSATIQVNTIVGSYTTVLHPVMEDIKNRETRLEYAAQAAIDRLNVIIAEGATELNLEQKATADLQKLLQSTEQGMNDNLQKICKSLADEKRNEILGWISEVTYQGNHELARSSRQVKTGHWLFDKKDYIDWRQCTSSAIFWLNGISGSGKTTLASFFIDTIEKTKSTNDALAYFHCKYGDSKRQDPASIMRSIVKQLSLMAPEGSLPEPVVSIYKKHMEDGFKSGSLRFDESKELILQLSKAFKQTFIVIDGLDECSNDNRMQLVAALKSLRSSADGLKLFFTSQHDDDISSALESEADVYTQPSDNSGDIESFVRAEVERCISADKLLRQSVAPDLKHLVARTLIDGANGMFQWVRLQIDNLSRRGPEPDMKNALKTLPKGLEATYSVIWERINSDSPENCNLAKRVLKFIICARRPLTSEEILDFVAIKPMQETETPNPDSVTVREIITICQRLIAVDKEDGVFRPVHFSVAEFLLKKFTQIEAHTVAAEVCLTLILLSKVHDANGNHQHHNPLATYALENWAEHVHLSGYTLLHSAAQKGQTVAVKLILGLEHVDPNCKDESYGTTPLYVAAREGHEEVVKLILARQDVDPNSKDRNGNSPLHAAVEKGHEGVVKLLLEREDLDPNIKEESYGNTPLRAAAQAGNEAIVMLLLGRKDLDPNSKDNYGHTLLYDAAQKKQEGIVKLILTRQDADPNCKDETYGDTPLHAAAREGHEEVVDLILAREDADPNSRDDYGGTPLHDAAREGQDAIIKLLLRRADVDPNSKGDSGNSPLHVAVQAWHKTAVEELLKRKDTNPNLQDDHDITPLYDAAREGQDAIIKLLLQRADANPNSKGESGNTPLHVAVQAGHEAAVEQLLKRQDTNPNSQNDYGCTPLHEAARRGQEPIVRLLLQRKDVDFEQNDNDGKTPANIAAMRGHYSVTKLMKEQSSIAKERRWVWLRRV